MRQSLQNKIDYSIDLLRKAEKMALRLDPENGFWLAFSGGKDSQVLYHVAQMAGVRFKAHMNLTSVDPPEVIRFVKRQYPDVELIKPRMSIFEMAKRKHILPTMRFRWCCAEFKETGGVGKVTLIGIRKQESARRSKRNEVELGNHKFSGNFANWKRRPTAAVAATSRTKMCMAEAIATRGNALCIAASMAAGNGNKERRMNND